MALNVVKNIRKYLFWKQQIPLTFWQVKCQARVSYRGNEVIVTLERTSNTGVRGSSMWALSARFVGGVTRRHRMTEMWSGDPAKVKLMVAIFSCILNFSESNNLRLHAVTTAVPAALMRLYVSLHNP